MEFAADIQGIENVNRALEAAFPNNPRVQQAVVNSTLGYSARQTILKEAKRLAPKRSGALAEALTVRAMNARTRRARGSTGGMQVLPYRYDKKAMAMYVRYWAPKKPSSAQTWAQFGIDGIRHGHLVEWGHSNIWAQRDIEGKPFMWPALKSSKSAFVNRFATDFERKLELRVKLEAAKRAKKGRI